MNSDLFYFLIGLAIVLFLVGIYSIYKTWKKTNEPGFINSGVWNQNFLTSLIVIISAISLFTTVIAIDSADKYNEKIVENLSSSTSSLAKDVNYTGEQVKILQKKFDLENRPWIKVSKIEYQFLPANSKTIDFEIYSDGLMKCIYENYFSSEDCTDALLNFSNPQEEIGYINIIISVKNVGDVPALIRDADISGIIGEHPLKKEWYAFPNDEILLGAFQVTTAKGFNLVHNNLNMSGLIKYKLLSNDEKTYLTKFSSDLGIKDSDLTGAPRNAVYSNIRHEFAN
jgi:hypothetical protein